MKVTIGNLIDSLTIENIRIWMAEDVKRDPKAKPSDIVKATKITNKANVKRNCLIEAIDLEMNEIAEGKKQMVFAQGTTKMYGKKWSK